MRHILLLATLTFALTGCSTKAPLGHPEEPYATDSPPKAGQYLALSTGYGLSQKAFLHAATDSRIVYAGETHDNPAAHRVQLDLLRTLQQRFPGEISLGMEMFTRGQQPILEAWIQGPMTEKAFLRQSQWDSTWGFDWRLYRDLLLFAKEHRIPVIGLNAERDLVRALGRTPAQTLDEKTRQRLPQMDFNDPYHKALSEATFAGHSGGRARMDGFLRVQTLWDETMAESIARYLDSPDGQDKRMLVIAGARHVSYGIGIPRRVHRRLPASFTLVGIEEVRLPKGQEETKGMQIEPVDLPMRPFDYIAWVDYEQLEPRGVKLGVMIEPKTLRITGLKEGRPAANAGMQKDDILLAIDDEKLQEFFDLKYVLNQRKAGEKATVKIRRGESTLELEVTFMPPAPLPKGHP